VLIKVVKVRRSLYGLAVMTCIAAAIGLRCGEKGTEPEPPRYGLSPDSADVELSSAVQFTLIYETPPLEVVWCVDDVHGGSPETGMITPDGLFIAPYEVPAAGYVTITAEAQLDSLVRSSAKVAIQSGYGTPHIRVNPDSIGVALGDSVELSPAPSGCPLTEPQWSMVTISGDPGNSGTMRSNGTYVAPVSISDDLTLMVMVTGDDCLGKIGIGKILVRAPEPFTVQMEDFTASYGSGITNTVPCPGGFAVCGLDVPGEWIEIPYHLEIGGMFDAVIHYAPWENNDLGVTVSEATCGVPPEGIEVAFSLRGKAG
jgi:hypothetical protein